MKSRIATIFTVLALIGGSGGAIAVASHSSSGGPNGAGAAKGQYCEGKEKGHGKGHAKNSHKGDDCGQGDDNHGHEGPHGHHGHGGRK